MPCGHYYIIFDKTGFPLIRKDGWNYYISLFPVSKYQFETFMIENGPAKTLYTDKWYRGILTQNPRVSWENWNNKPWQLFITGVNFNELVYFFNYLGGNFRLPTYSEWKQLHDVSQQIRQIKNQIINSCGENSAPPVKLWLEKVPFPLTDEGLFEMVKDNNTVNYVGKPFYEFYNNTFDPVELKSFYNIDDAIRYVGFRVVKMFREIGEQIVV